MRLNKLIIDMQSSIDEAMNVPSHHAKKRPQVTHIKTLEHIDVEQQAIQKLASQLKLYCQYSLDSDFQTLDTVEQKTNKEILHDLNVRLKSYKDKLQSAFISLNSSLGKKEDYQALYLEKIQQLNAYASCARAAVSFTQGKLAKAIDNLESKVFFHQLKVRSAKEQLEGLQKTLTLSRFENWLLTGAPGFMKTVARGFIHLFNSPYANKLADKEENLHKMAACRADIVRHQDKAAKLAQVLQQNIVANEVLAKLTAATSLAPGCEDGNDKNIPIQINNIIADMEFSKNNQGRDNEFAFYHEAVLLNTLYNVSQTYGPQAMTLFFNALDKNAINLEQQISMLNMYIQLVITGDKRVIGETLEAGYRNAYARIKAWEKQSPHFKPSAELQQQVEQMRHEMTNLATSIKQCPKAMPPYTVSKDAEEIIASIKHAR